MKKLCSLLLALAMLLSLAACASRPSQTRPDAVTAPAAEPATENEPVPESEPSPESEPAPPTAPSPLEPWTKLLLYEPKRTANDEYNFFDFDGFTVRIPNVYADLMTVETPCAVDGVGQTLMVFYETASREQAAQDFPGEETGLGWLGALVRMDQLDFESWLCGEQLGETLFARDGNGFYYLLSQPTDVRVYRSDENYDAENLADWGALCEWVYRTLPEQLIAENGLEPYDASELYDRGATYGGEQKTYVWFPQDDSPIESVTFVLTQPAAQGNDGIWCVDRYYLIWETNEYNGYQQVDTYLNFPVAEGIPQPADIYWPWLQDFGISREHQLRLDPLETAVAFTQSPAWYFGALTAEDLVESVG